jgi:hypothetical protein
MSRPITFLVSGLALIIGISLGAFATHRYDGFIDRIFISSTAAEEIDATITVFRIRQTNTKGVVETLERRLDDALMRLGANYATGPIVVNKALKKAKEYRAEFPRTTSLDFVADAVARTLALGRDENAH